MISIGDMMFANRTVEGWAEKQNIDSFLTLGLFSCLFRTRAPITFRYDVSECIVDFGDFLIYVKPFYSELTPLNVAT